MTAGAGVATLAHDLAASLDPCATFRAGFGVEPEPWQAALLRSEDRRTLLLCARQTGKSLSTVADALHRIVYQPGALVVCVAPSARQSSEWFLKLRHGFRALGRPVGVAAENESELRLTNGSRVVSLPGSEPTVRGLSSVDLLIIEEAARVDGDVWVAVLPMLAAAGRLLAITTPAGMRGRFHELWTEGGPGWRRVKVTAEDSGQYTPERLVELRSAMSERAYSAEYLADFASNLDSYFDPRAIRRAFDCHVAPLPGFPTVKGQTTWTAT